MIMGDYDVDLVIVMLWVMRLYCFVIRHMCYARLSIDLCVYRACVKGSFQ